MIPQVRTDLGDTPAWFAYQSGLCVCHRLVLIDTLAKVVSLEEAQSDAAWLPWGKPWPDVGGAEESSGDVLPLLPVSHPFVPEWSNPLVRRAGFRLIKTQSGVEVSLVDAVLAFEMMALARALLETERAMHAAYAGGAGPVRVATWNYRRFAPVFTLDQDSRGLLLSGSFPKRRPSALPHAPRRHGREFLARFREALESMDRVTGLPHEWDVSVFAEAASNRGGLSGRAGPNPERPKGLFSVREVMGWPSW